MAVRKILGLMLLCLLFRHSGVAQTANPQNYQYVFTVAKDGSGQYTYIQDAINAMRVYPLARIVLYIKNGVYNEKIELPETNVDVSFIGESVEKTIIVFNDYSGRGKLNTFTSYTAKISGNRFIAENITFSNNAGRVGQAVALYVNADKAVFKNCRFLGDQDTIFAGGEDARQYFKDCYIEGTTDFIFGPATALFENCTIHAKTDSYITAASTTPGKKFGLVFLNCNITVDPSVKKLYLGRPWRSNAKTAFIGCAMPAQVVAAGWDNWGNIANETTVLYAEYKNSGPGAATAGRAKWSKQLTDIEARLYTAENVLGIAGNDNWIKNIPATPFKWPVKN